ncbi:MAG: ABC transporter ATP-binding protein [Nocardioidaceae bacterium]
MPAELITERARELLDQVGLTNRAKERVESYSRGMKQRLHIAKTLIHRPPVVILDEPTIGLDPGAAIEVRSLIAGLVPHHTVMLSMHDMYEADALCHQPAIIDQGVIVAEGTPAELRAEAPVDRQVIIVVAGSLDGPAPALLDEVRGLSAVLEVGHQVGVDDTLTLSCTESTAALDQTLALRRSGASVRIIEVRDPTLEDAFLGATGRTFEPADGDVDGESE